MKFFLIASFLLASIACTVSADQTCESLNKNGKLCNSKFSAYDVVEPKLQAYVNQLITKSYEYMLLASNFGRYTQDRPGFRKLFRSLSDEAWENSIDLIKYMTSRGGKMDFGSTDVCSNTSPFSSEKNYELNELDSLSYALDVEKVIATDAHCIHREISHANAHTKYDPAVAHYLDEELIEPQVDVIRKLSGYVNDLKHLYLGSDKSLPTYLFDEYLEKQ